MNRLNFGAEFSHDDLVEMGRKWLFDHEKCPVVLTEPKHGQSPECPDVIGFNYCGGSTLIECKVSRADFLADAKKSFRKLPQMGMGTYRWYLCSEGIITEGDLPIAWGLLVVRDDRYGRHVAKVREALPQESNAHAERMILTHLVRRGIVRTDKGVNIRVFLPLETEKPSAMKQTVSVRPFQEAIL